MIIFAHRGASGYQSENTLASFKKALEIGVDGIEFDVHLSKDGHVVVIHDSSIFRTTKRLGFIKNKSLADLKKLDAGKGEQIPTLQEVLDLVNKKAKAQIELKGKGTALPVAKIINEYVQKKKWKYNDFLVSSFNHKELREFKKLLPQIRTGALIIGIKIQFDKYKNELNAYSINMWCPFVRKSVVDEAHRRGLKIFAYTVNSKKEIKRMREIGVDCIFTNYPDRAK